MTLVVLRCVGVLVDDGSDAEQVRRQPLASLRGELLALKGIGPETADSILLYAAGHRAFVVDAYTKRIFTRHGCTPLYTMPMASSIELSTCSMRTFSRGKRLVMFRCSSGSRQSKPQKISMTRHISQFCLFFHCRFVFSIFISPIWAEQEMALCHPLPFLILL